MTTLVTDSMDQTERAEIFSGLNDRTQEVFRRVVESYLSNGTPTGSRALTRDFSERVSAATIRNVMQDLEYLGLLDAPHVSAGRVPTELGLRMFVDGILEVEDMAAADLQRIESSMDGQSETQAMLDRVGSALSGLTQGASLVLAPKQDAPVKHIEFVSLGPDRALVVLVLEDGTVENRVFEPPHGQTPSSLREAANFLNAFAVGKPLSDIRTSIKREIGTRRMEIDSLAADLVEQGLAVWDRAGSRNERLIVRGRSNLLASQTDPENLDRIKQLFDDLERKQDIAQFLELTDDAEGVRIFIGSENKLFSLSGSSVVVSPYMNADRKVIGAVGVIGPTRLNYGRIVPIVNYTAQAMTRVLAKRG